MRTIRKGAGAGCLYSVRAGARVTGAVWPPQEAGCVEEIREVLIDEQGALCAYCMQRIRPRGYRDGQPQRGGMKIEHWLARSTHPGHTYAWHNLLGVCGGEYLDARGVVRRCDASRGATPLHIHPAGGARSTTELQFRRLLPGGEPPPYPGVWIHGTTAQARQDIETLNLNAEHLVRNRRAALDVVDRMLQRAGTSTQYRGVLRTLWRESSRPGKLAPYARVVRDDLEKKMRRQGMTL